MTLSDNTKWIEGQLFHYMCEIYFIYQLFIFTMSRMQVMPQHQKCLDWINYTVKNIALYQIDLTTQHHSNGNIVLNQKVKNNHYKMNLLY